MEIPIISLKTAKGILAKQIDAACRQTGFFLITDHDVPEVTTHGMLDSAKTFFEQNLSRKMETPMSKTYPYGYSGYAQETLSSDGILDLKESFCIGPMAGTINRRWPNIPEMEKTWTIYYAEMERVCSALHDLFEIALQIEAGWFQAKTNQHASALRALNYPAQRNHDKLITEAGEHTDYGIITLLQTNAPGLQAKTPDQKWVDVPFDSNCLIVNIGDLMQRLTNDQWVSTPHRVVGKHHNQRQSAAFFHNLNKDTKVTCFPSCCRDYPAKYEPIIAGEYLTARHNAATQTK